MNVGRNDPCPCGSGKKFKKCCGLQRAGSAAATPESRRADAAKANDQELTDRLMHFARQRGGPLWLQGAAGEFTGHAHGDIGPAELQIAIPWMLFHRSAEGDAASMANRFLVDQGSRLAPSLRALLEAQLRSWMSVWEVREVQRGTGELMVDLLTGEERFIHDVASSHGLSVRDALLARVVDIDGISFFGGIHLRALGPRETEEIVRLIKRACRVRTKHVKVERLRDNELELEMVDLWSTTVERLDNRPPPTLNNTDGDPLELTTDHFDFTPRQRDEVVRLVTTLPFASEPDDEEDGALVVVLCRPDPPPAPSSSSTVIGRVIVKAGRLSLETNSTKRADALRLVIEAHVGPLVRHRLREGTNMRALFEEARRKPPKERADAPEEFRTIARELKERHMQGWVDESIPALGGLTPREAAASPKGRKALELLLREFEHHEGRLPEDERFDMKRLRATLGMP
jgi:hypothetical protein